VPLFQAFLCLKYISEFSWIGLRANGLPDKDLELLDREFFKMNCWWKNEAVVSFQLSVFSQGKWLGDKELGKAVRVNAPRKSE
jgi:hypothetical protein